MPSRKDNRDEIDYIPSDEIPLDTRVATSETTSQTPTTSSEERFQKLLHRIKSHVYGSSKGVASKKLASSTQESSTIHRHKATEADEDKQLLKSQKQAQTSIIRLTQSPMYIENTTLHSYQIDGLNWLLRCYNSKINCILADEMGLGKTIQTIALLGFVKQYRHVNDPHLVIVPKSVMGNWKNEIEKWCPILKVFLFHGSKEERAQMRENMHKTPFDICITSYEMANIERTALQQFSWHCLVIDEAHKIKNEHSVLSQVVRTFKPVHRLLITGTPLQNNLHELWALLNYLLPEVFDNSENFDAWFNVKGGQSERKVMEQLHKIMKPFMLRRLKTDVETEIPPKKEIYVECGMTEMQRQWYKSILTKDIQAMKGGKKMRLLNIVTQLRKCCDHPYLFDGAEPGPPYSTGEHLVTNSGKLSLLDRLLKRLKEQGSRVLVFSQMTRMLDILEDYCWFRQYQYCRLDGQTSSEDRERYMEQFNAPDSEKFIFLLSTRAGGLGINLATADTVILFDSDWNPQMDLQAQDRAHCIGQKKPVNVYRLITKGTVEEKIYQRAVKKLYLDAVVIQQGRMADKNNSLSKDELLSMIKFGAEESFRTSDDSTVDISEEQLDAILERGAKKAKEMDEKYKEQCQNNLLTFSLKEDQSLYEFEGLDYSSKPTKTIQIENIDENTTEEDISNNCGAVSSSVVNVFIHPNRSNALLTLKTKTNAVRLMEHLSRVVSSDKPWRLKYCKKNDSFIETLENMAQSTQSRQTTSSRTERSLNRLTRGYAAAGTVYGGPKMTKYFDFQFVDIEKLQKFWQKEIEHVAKTKDIKKERRRIMKENKTLPPDAQLALPPIPSSSEALTREEQQEKKRTLSQGFPNWTKTQFHQYINACAKYGRNDVKNIYQNVEGKQPGQVKRYHKVFWKRYTEITDYERLLQKIKKGEAIIRTIQLNNQVLKWKTKHYENPWRDLTFDYEKAPDYVRSSTFSESEDRFLWCCSAQYGYGAWNAIAFEVRRNWEFRFNLHIRTRGASDFGQRVDALLRLVTDEFEKYYPQRKLPHEAISSVEMEMDQTAMSDEEDEEDKLLLQSKSRL